MTDKKSNSLIDAEELRSQIHFSKKKEIIPPKNPWDGDVLKRSDLAERLTNLVRGQDDPYTISMHGDWGTGKTFLLKRWQKQLENDGFKCIYYNAWEDDYILEDPLISIIGQLSSQLKGYINETLMEQISNGAEILVTSAGTAIANRAIKSVTAGGDAKLKDLTKQRADSLISKYSARSESKKALMIGLTKMAHQIKRDTKQPLVFIVDELDRCRPTFAVELLERVKHIFEIKNIVFVFGVNRDQLSKTVESVYGDIDSDTYLRRFFDMELALPEAQTGEFFGSLVRKYKVEAFFLTLTDCVKSKVHSDDLDMFREMFSCILESMTLSLRDIQNCVNSMVFVGKNIKDGEYIYPYIIAILVALRLKEKTLYEEFKQGDCSAGKIMDYIHERLPQDKEIYFPYQSPTTLYTQIAKLEAFLYQISFDEKEADIIIELLEKDGAWPRKSPYLSQKLDSEEVYRRAVIHWTKTFRVHLQRYCNYSGNHYEGLSIKDIISLIDISQPDNRRFPHR